MLDSYTSARKVLITSASIILAWAVVGATVTGKTTVDAGIAAIAVTNGSLLPFVLCWIVLYSVYATTLRWLLIGERTSVLQLVDHNVTITGAFVAMVTFLVRDLRSGEWREYAVWSALGVAAVCWLLYFFIRAVNALGRSPVTRIPRIVALIGLTGLILLLSCAAANEAFRHGAGAFPYFTVCVTAFCVATVFPAAFLVGVKAHRIRRSGAAHGDVMNALWQYATSPIESRNPDKTDPYMHPKALRNR